MALFGYQEIETNTIHVITEEVNKEKGIIIWTWMVSYEHF